MTKVKNAKKSLLLTPSISTPLALFLLATLVSLSGCVPNDDYYGAITQFQQSSNTLIAAYQTLMVNANITEENHFIDSQVFATQPMDPTSIQSKDVLTPDEIKLRTAAIKALADYTTALATLASGKPAAQIDADAAKASTSLQTLSTDAATALGHPPPATTTTTTTTTTATYSGPVSSAVAAIGEVISLIEKHRGESEVKESLRKNDPQLKALFQLISKESTDLYERQKSTLSDTGVILFHDYNTARQATPANPAMLMQLSDRIKQYRKDSSLISGSDPSSAIDAFQKSHDALVEAILAPKEKKKESLAQLIAAVKAFATEVTPLGQDVYAFGKSF